MSKFTLSFSVCPEGFKYYNQRSCLKVQPELRGRADHETECQSLGGHLAAPRTERENDQLKAFVRDQDIQTNIVLGIQSSPGGWRYDEDGSPVFTIGEFCL